jgi:major vault protein
MGESHIKDVHEEAVGEVFITTLTNRQYCFILDPVDENGKHMYGKKIRVKGEANFFLKPGERLQNGIQDIIILGEDEALLLQAKENIKGKKAGELWMIKGPTEFIPEIEEEIIERRKQIPLDENEGIYVRDVKTGEVKMITGKTYLLDTTEQLWEKELTAEVENLLAINASGSGFATASIDEKGKMVYQTNVAKGYKRDKTRVITFRAPHNSAVQLFDYKSKQSRVMFGPELVMLEPYEEISVLTLSGKVPKEENVIKNLALLLGPDFMTDLVIVETSDHAKLYLKLAYSWKFDVDKEDEASKQKIFNVKDFVGDCCKAMASRIRGCVSGVAFDHFHKNSTDIIQNAVFKKDSSGNAIPFRFPTNNLIVTSVDIQSVEIVDEETRASLQKSVNLAIEINEKSKEASARHEAERLEQAARGQREKQRIDDLSEAEKSRKKLLELQAESASVQTTGKAKADALAKAKAARIKAEAEVKKAELSMKAVKIEQMAEIEHLKQKNEAETTHLEVLLY